MRPGDPLQADCEHRDSYGSTIVYVQDRPQDGICILCDQTFPRSVTMRDLEAASIDRMLRRQDAKVWTMLERMPDFNERIRRGQAQLNRGERVQFERPSLLTRLWHRIWSRG